MSLKRKNDLLDIYDEEPKTKKIRRYPSPTGKQTHIPHTSPGSGERRTDEVSFSDTESLGCDTESSSLSPVSPISRRQHKQSMAPFKELLQINYKYLKDEVDPSGFANQLCQHDLLDNQRMEMIKECESRRRKADLILKGIMHKVIRAKKGDIKEIKTKVFDALRDSGHGHIIKQMKGPRKVLNYENNADVLRHFVLKMDKELRRDVEPKDFIDDLVVLNAITLTDHEDIFNMTHRKDRLSAIIDRALDPAQPVTIDKLIGPLIEKYEYLYTEYRIKYQRKEKRIAQKKLAEVKGTTLKEYPTERVTCGSKLKVKINFQLSDNNQPVAQETGCIQTPLTAIEKRVVTSCTENVAGQAQLADDIMDSCAALFEKMTISSVVIHISTWSEDALQEILNACKQAHPIRWLSSMLSSADMAMLERLGVDKVKIEVSVSNQPARQSECHCVMTKDAIRQNFPQLMLNMRGSRKTIQRFLDTDLISEEHKRRLNMILHVKEIQRRNECFLRYLIDEQCPSVCLCILEEELKLHGCHDLVNCGASPTREDKSATKKLSTADLIHHKEYLVEELDARTFMPAFSASIHGDPATKLAEDVAGQISRQARTRRFLEYLCENKTDLNWLTQELLNQGLEYVLKHMWKWRMEDKTTVDCQYVTWSSVLSQCGLLMEEVDILRLKGPLVEASVIDRSAVTELECILSRRRRMAMFLKLMTKERDKIAAQFVRVLSDSEYAWIGQEILEVSKRDYTCPMVKSVEKGRPALKYDTLVLEGFYKVKVEETADSDDQTIEEQIECAKSDHAKILLDEADSDVIIVSDDDDNDTLTDAASTSWLSRKEAEAKDEDKDRDTQSLHHTKQWIDRHFSDPSISDESESPFVSPSSPCSTSSAIFMKKSSVSKPLYLMKCPSPAPSLSSGYHTNSIISCAGHRFRETDSIATINSPGPIENMILNSPAPTLNSPAPTLNSPVPTLNSPVPTLNSPAPTLNSPAPTLSSPVPTLNSPVPTPNSLIPTLDSPVPAPNSLVPMLDSPVSTLDSPVPTLSSPVPTLNSVVPTLNSPAPTLNSPVPTLNCPVPTEASITLQSPNSVDEMLQFSSPMSIESSLDLDSPVYSPTTKPFNAPRTRDSGLELNRSLNVDKMSKSFNSVQVMSSVAGMVTPVSNPTSPTYSHQLQGTASRGNTHVGSTYSKRMQAPFDNVGKQRLVKRRSVHSRNTSYLKLKAAQGYNGTFVGNSSDSMGSSSQTDSVLDPVGSPETLEIYDGLDL